MFTKIKNFIKDAWEGSHPYTPYKANQKKKFKALNIGFKRDIIPYESWVDNVYTLKGPQAVNGFIFNCTGLFSCSPQILKEFERFMCFEIPSNTAIEYLLIVDDEIADPLEDWKEKSMQKNSAMPEIYQDLINERCNFLNNYNKESCTTLRLKNAHFFVSCSNKQGVENIKAFARKIKQFLEGVGIFSTFVEPAGLLWLCRKLCGMSHEGFINKNFVQQFEALGESFEEDKNGININAAFKNQESKRLQAFEVVFNILPEFGQLLNILGDPLRGNLTGVGCYAVVISVLNDAGDVQEQLLRRQGVGEIKFSGSFAARFQMDQKERAEQWSKALEEVSRGAKFVKYHCLVLSIARQAEADEAAESLLTLFRALNCHLIPLTFNQIVGLSLFFPLSTLLNISEINFIDIDQRTTTAKIAKLLPFFGEVKSFGEFGHGSLYFGKRGQIMTYDNFTNNNYNIMITGKTGSGKSVFMQDLLFKRLAEGAKVFVLDVGGSYKNLYEVQNMIEQGEYIDFSENTEMSLNPFALLSDALKNATIGDGAYIEELKNMTEIILYSMINPTSKTSDEEACLISKYLTLYIESTDKNEGITIDGFVKFLQKSTQDARIIAIGDKLFPSTQKGRFKNYLSTEKKQATFKKQLTVIDLELLIGDPYMLGFVLQVLAMQIVSQIYNSDRKKISYICFDEGWQTALTPAASSLVERLARTARKYNCALIIGTQSISDFYKEGVSNEIEAQLSNKFFLSQEITRAPAYLDEKKQIIISTLETKKGQYSEFFLYRDNNNYAVCRLLLDPFTATLFSSTPATMSAIKERIKRREKNIIEIVREVMQNG